MANRNDSEQVKNFSAQQKMGLYWEVKVCEMLNNLGYDCELIDDWANYFDIQAADGSYIEVKAANVKQTSKGKGRIGYRYCFDVSKVFYDDLADHSFTFMLVCVDDDGNPHHFLVPSEVIKANGKKNISITNRDPQKYSGWLAQYAF